MKKLGLILMGAYLLGLCSALLFGWTATYDTTTPAGTDAPSVLDDRIREIKLGVQERQNIDHYWPLSGSQVSHDDAGKHRKVTFQEVLGTKPTLTAGQLAIYTKLTDSNEAVWLESDAGTERQLTTGSGLALKLADADGAVLKTGAQTIAGVKSFESLPLLVPGDPTDANHPARKQYVDDLVSGQGFYFSGATVFNDTMTTANAWQDLDLSSIVGTNRALVFLEVGGSGSPNATYMCKPKGYGSATFQFNYSWISPNIMSITSTAQFAYMTLMTDSSGCVQHGANGTTTNFVIKLLCYVKGGGA